MPVTTFSDARRDPGRVSDRWLAAPRRLGRQSVSLFVILTAQLMVVLDGTIVNVALPHIQRGLSFSGSGLSWVLNAYILTFGGLLLLGARAGDLLGRRRTFLFGIALFSVGSLAGGLATAGWMLLAARGLQGVGAAFAAPSSLALLTTLFSEGGQRVRAIGLFTTVSAAGGAIGLLAGGLLTEWASWRWVMFVNVPIGVAVWLVGRFVLVETERRHGRFDIAGAITSTLGMTAIVLGLVQAGSTGWADPITVLSLVAGVALLGVFVWNERRAQEPILPLRLLTNATRSGANVARGLVYAGMYGTFFFLSQFLQDVQGHSPLIVGVGFLPIPASVFLGSQLTSKVLVPRLRPKVIMLLGVSLAGVSLLLSSQLHAGSSYLQVLVNLVLLGAGAGILTGEPDVGVAGRCRPERCRRCFRPGQRGAAIGRRPRVGRACDVVRRRHQPCAASHGWPVGHQCRPRPRAGHRVRRRRWFCPGGAGHRRPVGEAGVSVGCHRPPRSLRADRRPRPRRPGRSARHGGGPRASFVGRRGAGVDRTGEPDRNVSGVPWAPRWGRRPSPAGARGRAAGTGRVPDLVAER